MYDTIKSAHRSIGVLHLKLKNAVTWIRSKLTPVRVVLGLAAIGGAFWAVMLVLLYRGYQDDDSPIRVRSEVDDS